MPLLSLLLAIPAIGALSIAFMDPQHTRLIRGAATATATATLLLSLWLLAGFDTGEAGLQYAELRSWNPELGSFYALGVDGLSLPMVLLSALLSLIALLASYSLTNRVKGYHVCLLMLEFGMLGVFMAQDWALFYVFWEVTLIPLFFLIDQWGGKGRHTASLNFVLYTMGGSVFMLISLLMIYGSSAGHSTAMASMTQAAMALPREQQVLVFLGLLIGFGVKMPTFPLHGWLPLAHVEAPSPVSILLSGVLLKMGAYGLFRATGMLPQAATALQSLLAALALVSIVYGGLLAWRQSDLKAMIAYSSISHMGIVLLGLSTLNTTGLMGASLQMTAHGLVAGSLFLLIGLLYERTHTREIADYGSLAQVTPRFAFFATLTLLASLGLPGLVGFTAEIHALIGGFQRWGWWTVLVSVAVLVSAAYAVRTIVRLFTGPVKPSMRELRDLHGTELAAAGTLAFGIVALGLIPAPLLDLIGTSVTTLSAGLPQQTF
ncbi:MAG: proton-translocating NADH-quinone oxidoreductase, chain [Proteobacteria bacterium]|nr:proton-translocating NADH-quinone oxidoreductase, chain [Pseudomonadota bacterium]